MFNYSVSFGHKIPIAACQVQEKLTGRFVKATVYEYDCQNKTDIDEVKSIKDLNTFRTLIAGHMYNKYTFSKFGHDIDKRFFAIQENDGDIIGLSQTNNVGEDMNISYIETLRNKKYRFAGQTLIAAIGGELLSSGGRKLLIRCPVDSALHFYFDDCRFDVSENGELYMDKKNLKKFIERTEERTHAPVININA